MNPKNISTVTVQTLLALRQEGDALRVITDNLRVREMGPSDHIRTKHEVKAFIETGDATAAESLIRRAAERIDSHRLLSQRVTEQQHRGQRI